MLKICPEFAHGSSDAGGVRKRFEGPSIQTICYLLASGMGSTRVTQRSVRAVERTSGSDPACDIPSHPVCAPVPKRRVMRVWRQSSIRCEAIAALHNAVQACRSGAVTRLS